MSVATPPQALRRALESMLAALDYPFQEGRPVPELDWNLEVRAGQIMVIVGPPKGRDFLVMVAPINIDPIHVKALKGLPNKERQMVIERIALAMLSSDISYNIMPEMAPVPERIQITGRLCAEALTRTAADAELRKVRDAAMKVILILNAGLKTGSSDVAVIEAPLPKAGNFEDWAANLVPVSGPAAEKLFAMAEERGVDVAHIVDELLARK